MLKESFDKFLPELEKALSVENGEWSVKGFIDIDKNIYTISTDTKVVSKIVELMIFPLLAKFAKEKGYAIKLTPHQNYYPDLTFVDNKTKKKYAIDLKSTYRVDENTLNGMTLGAFTGYFRNRNDKKNITFPYKEYEEHYVLGIMYSRSDLYNAKKYLEEKNKGKPISKKLNTLLSDYLIENSSENWKKLKEKAKFLEDKNRKDINNFIINEKEIYDLENFKKIKSVVRDFKIFFIEKWKIASDKPGSGNTKNIGGIKKIDEILSGNGIFAKEGKAVFDDYWQHYETKDMAKSADRDKPLFNNLETYLKWRNR